MVSLDDELVERRYRVEPADRLTPEQLYERRWALTVLEQALSLLRQERAEAGRGQEFGKLEGFLTGQAGRLRLNEVAAELGMTEEAVKTSLHRLRRRYGILLREAIGATVASRAASA